MITAKNNKQVKEIRKLLTSAKERRVKGLFVIEGERIVRDAPAEQIRQLYVSESFAKQHGDFSAYQNIETLSDEVFASVSDTVTPQGVLAVCALPQPAEEASLYAQEGPCRYLLLDGIQDPGNMGTILRTAEAAGVKAVIISDDSADLYNPKVLRATMGSIFRVPTIRTELTSAIEMLKAEGVTVYGAALDGANDYRDVDYSERLALVIGNEGNGISAGVLNAIQEKIYIPMQGQIESLNAAVSAAVLLYHFYR